MARSQRKSDARKNGRQLLTHRKRPQGITKHQPRPATFKQLSNLRYITPLRRSARLLDLERKTFTTVKEEHHQLPSPSTSSSHKQSSGRKRKRSVSPKPRSEETNNRYAKRCKALRQTPQTVQFQETVPGTNSPVFERPEGVPEASESEEKGRDDPVSYWAANHTWPDNFADSRAMSSNNTTKRQRTSDRSQSGKDGKSRSYSQSRKYGDVPEQYTKSFAKYIFTKGLDMDDSKGAKLVSPDSKKTCKALQDMKCVAISPTVYSKAETLEVVNLCRNRNEAMVNRDVTPLIVPPIKSLYLKDGVNLFEHFTDEVNTQWHESWVLAGPRPKPDLAVGFLSSAFTIAENEKLTNYTSFENLTRPTDDFCFPFLMCEVKCGNEALDYADRQNMHSCSVAVKALLKLEKKADQYREDKQFESLLGKILVYSISHDHTDARLYGYYALVEGEKWTYYRYHVRHFDIAHEERDLLALHNFARNVLMVYAPELLKRLREAITALPISSTLSLSAGTMNLEDDSQQSSQQPSQCRDAEGFVTPVLPASTQKLFDAQKEQIDKLLQLMEQQKEQQKEQKEQQKEQMKQQMDQMEQQMEELKSEKRELLALLKQRLK